MTFLADCFQNRCRYYMLLLIGVLSIFAVAQEDQTVLVGQILDARNGDPLVGANVFLVQSQIGASTDADGVFALNIRSAVSDDSLKVSFIGYNTFSIALAEYRHKSIIRLQPENLSLQDSILVTAERMDLVRQEIPHSRATIKAEIIERKAVVEISDVLKVIPSVRIRGNDIAGRTVEIRGSNTSEVNVYWDGVLLNQMGFDNVADLSVIPVENIEKIEVLKGANLVLLGGGAFGGVVNVTSKKRVDRSFYFNTVQGSFSSQNYAGEINVPIRPRLILNYFGQANGSKPEIEFFPGEAFSEKTENKNIDSRRQIHYLNLHYYGEQGEFTNRVFFYGLDYQKPLWENQRKNILFNSSYRGSLLGVSNLEMNASVLRVDDTVDRGNPQNDNLAKDDFLGESLNLRLLKRFESGQNEYQFLAEYFHDELENDREVLLGGSNTPRQVYTASLYDNRASLVGVAAFQNNVNNLPNLTWKTHLGLRGDFLATGDRYVSPTIGMQVKWQGDKWELIPSGNYGKNIRFSTLRENAYTLLNAPDGSFARLKPEISNSGEIGLVSIYTPRIDLLQDIRMEISWFRNTVFNKLLESPFDEPAVGDQIGRNVTDGFEGSVTFNQIFRRFQIIAAFTSLEPSNPLVYAFKPQDMVSLFAEYVARSGFYANSTFFYEGKSVAWFPIETNDPDRRFDISVQEFESANDIDVSVGYRFQVNGVHANLQFSGYNLLDNSSYRDYTLKKRTLLFGFGLRY